MTSLSLSFCGKQAVWYCTHGILHGCVTRLQAVQRVGSMYNDPKREAAGENNEERTVDVAWALQKWLKCVRPILGEGCNTGEIKEEEGRKKRVKRKAVSRLFLIPPLHVAKDDSAVRKGGMSTKWIVSQAKIQPVSFLNHTSGRLPFYFLFCFFCLVFSRNLRSGSSRSAASRLNLSFQFTGKQAESRQLPKYMLEMAEEQRGRGNEGRKPKTHIRIFLTHSHTHSGICFQQNPLREPRWNSSPHSSAAASPVFTNKTDYLGSVKWKYENRLVSLKI